MDWVILPDNINGSISGWVILPVYFNGCYTTRPVKLSGMTRKRHEHEKHDTNAKSTCMAEIHSHSGVPCK